MSNNCEPDSGEPLTGLEGLQEALRDVTSKLLSTAALDCVAANVRGGGKTTYTIEVTPSKTGEVYVTMDCTVTPVKRRLLVVAALENGRVYRKTYAKDRAVSGEAVNADQAGKSE